MNITKIDHPVDGQCQYFNPSQLEEIINSISEQKVMAASVSGTNLCKLSPCIPSPCQNSGTCSLKNVTGGYFCACRIGYEGVNCTIDTNECSQGNLLQYPLVYHSC